jgi:selenide,water dikinase
LAWWIQKNSERNTTAKEGDHITLSKPLGVGILSAAIKQEKISPEAYQNFLQYTTQLNKPGVPSSRV